MRGSFWSRELSLKDLRERNRAAYLLLVVPAWALEGFLLLLFLLLLFSAVNPWLHARVIVSGSMEPTIRTGSMVVVIPREEYRPGEIIAFRDPRIGRNVHRIVDEFERDGERYLVTKGDAVEMPDRFPVPLEEVEGKVVAIFPYLGYVAYLGYFAALVPVALATLRLARRSGARKASS